MASYGGHDNLRYVQMASEIFDFSSPFPYAQYTLMRQPGYPFFIRLSYILGFSLRFSQEILYIISGFFLAWSFYKYYRQKVVTIIFLILYIFAPASFFWNRETVQEVLYLPLITFILSCLIHLINSYSKYSSFLKWFVALGFGFAWFWNTRPEGLLMLPVVGIVYIFITVKAAHSQLSMQSTLKRIGYSLACLVIPVILVTSSISLTTYFKYGIFNSNDLTLPGIKTAYSRITSVSPDRWRYMVPVPRETRMEIYFVSPSFNRLSSYLESQKGHDWFDPGCKSRGICDDYAGGWFLWALRDAVADAGEYKSAPATEAFYKQIADEVVVACKSGKLKCNGTSSSLFSFAPTIRSEYVKPFFTSLVNLSQELVNQTLSLNLSSGEEDLNLRKTYYENITREPADFIKQRNQPFNKLKDSLITIISEVYKFLFPPLLVIAVIGIILRHISAVVRHSKQATGVPLYIIWLMLLCILIRIILIAYIDATSFPGGFRYLLPIVPLMLMVVAVGISYLIESLSLVRRIIVR